MVAAIDDALDDAGAHVAHGNLVVFGELAPLYVAFAELIERDGPTVDAAAITTALEAAAGGPIADDLATAFAWYGRALATDDPAERARAMLAANVVAVSHEQRRLQDDVTAAMVVGLETVEKVLDSLAEEMRRRSKGPARWKFLSRFGVGELHRLVEHVWEVAVTAIMMTLRVPGAELRLAEDVPPGADGRLFPLDLDVLTGPPVADPDLATVYGGWDRSNGTGRHDGARDWADLHERMSYIANLFRSRQQDETLAEAPFSAEQLAAMRAGRMPPPPLLPPIHGPSR